MVLKNHKHWLKLLVLFLLVGAGIWSGTAVSPAAASNAQQSARDPRFGAVESFWAPGEAAELGARFGIDVREPAFWEASMDVLRVDINRFEAIVDQIFVAG